MSIGRSSPGWATVDAGLRQYLETIRRFPMLSREEESRLARLVREEGDRAAADTLITSHLRLVGKVAMRYRGYGLPMADVIEEGNVGLMHAVRRFDTGRDCRLATYALWWIKATIQEYVLRSWSLVKLGTTANSGCAAPRVGSPLSRRATCIPTMSPRSRSSWGFRTVKWWK